MFLKNSEITKMILKIMKTNLKIVKQIITEYFSNANVKKVGICRTFQNYFKHTEKSKKMPKLRNKNKDRDGTYSNFKNIGRLKKTDGLPGGCDCFRYGVRIFRNSGCIPENPTAKLAYNIYIYISYIYS